MCNRFSDLLLVAIGTVLAQAAGAATFNVDSTADEVDAAPGNGVCATAGATCTLRAAVMEANALAGSDVIQVPAGNYVLSISAGGGGDADGDLDVTDNLTVIGAGTADTSVDATAMNRMFLVATGVSLTLQSMTLDPADHTAHGQIGQLVEGQDGSTLVLNDLVVLPYTGLGSENSLIRHTGVGLSATSLSWTSDSVVTFFMDLAPAGGASAVLTLDDVSVQVQAGAGRAPGLRLQGSIPTTLEVTNSLFDASATSDGSQPAISAVLSSGPALTFTLADTQIVEWPGNGAFLNADPLNASILQATVTTQSAQPLTISASSGGTSVADSLLVYNDTGCCTAFQLFGTAPTILRNSTVVVADGNGVFELLAGSVHSSTIVAKGLQNSIDLTLRNSVLTGPCFASAGDLVSEGYNLIADTTNCTFAGDTTGNILDVDPQLDILADNGGPTRTMHPLAGSLLLDNGNPATPGSGGTACEVADQRGVTRPQDGTGDASSRCDIGAVESVGVPDPVLDFGDAPWPYPTLAADDGARHRLSSLFLGLGSSAETDGLPSLNADGDNQDDGLAFLGPFVPGASTEVEVTVSENATIEVWWDFDRDGVWNDPGDQQPVQQNISAGTTSYFISVPSYTPAGDVYVRARVSSTGGSPTGKHPDGEVEDYKVTVVEPPFVRAFPGDDRYAAVGGTVQIGGDPAADGGVSPYSYDWTLTGEDGATFTVDSTTIPNPTVTATAEGYIDACLEVMDSMSSMDDDCITVDIFCADADNQDPMFTSDNGVEDYWAEFMVESEEYTVSYGGDVIFHAGSKVVLGDGFSVQSGARFAIDLDSNINMGCL